MFSMYGVCGCMCITDAGVWGCAGVCGSGAGVWGCVKGVWGYAAGVGGATEGGGWECMPLLSGNGVIGGTSVCSNRELTCIHVPALVYANNTLFYIIMDKYM